MSTRRTRFHDFYAVAPPLRDLVAKGEFSSREDRDALGIPQASAADRYHFHGDAEADGVVVRLDLNGYSTWARGRPIRERVLLLDKFFSSVVPLLDKAGGVYFRDEGDCIVCLFSSYFGLGHSPRSVSLFCRNVVSKPYGDLTAKACVASGAVAIFQKAHETGTDDWSAEGEPFVRAARLEQGVSSGQRVNYFANDYVPDHADSLPIAAPGERYYWEILEEKAQIPGLGFAGGWTDLKVERFLPGGRV